MKHNFRYLTEDEKLKAPGWATHYQFNKDIIIWESEDYFYKTGFNGKKVKQKSKLTKCRLISAKGPEVLTIDNCFAYLLKNANKLDQYKIYSLYNKVKSKSDKLTTKE